MRQDTGRCGCDLAAIGSPTISFGDLPLVLQDQLHRRVELLDAIELVQHPPKSIEPVGHIRLQLDHLAIGLGRIEMLVERLAGLCEAKPGFEGLRPDARQLLEELPRRSVVARGGQQLAEPMDRIRVFRIDLENLPIACSACGSFLA